MLETEPRSKQSENPYFSYRTDVPKNSHALHAAYLTGPLGIASVAPEMIIAIPNDMPMVVELVH